MYVTLSDFPRKFLTYLPSSVLQVTEMRFGSPASTEQSPCTSSITLSVIPLMNVIFLATRKLSASVERFLLTSAASLVQAVSARTAASPAVMARVRLTRMVVPFSWCAGAILGVIRSPAPQTRPGSVVLRQCRFRANDVPYTTQSQSERSSARSLRSEERRVGKECRSRWSRCHYKEREGWDDLMRSATE